VTKKSNEPKRAVVRRLRGLGEPVRVAMLDSLLFKPQSATELAAEVRVPVDRVRYQLGRLKADGLILVHHERPRRGTLEQVYVADPRRTEEFESKLAAEAPAARRLTQETTVRMLFSGLLMAIRAGAFHDRADYTVARAPLTLDAQGYDEVQTILEQTMERLFEIREESLARLERSGQPPLAAISGMLHFERTE
jgi:predicted ArsR family transcriptional regulator